nr:EOG090X0AVR [Scapholeberis mucronata]
MIPPGMHYVYYSSVDKHGLVGPRSGFYHYFSKKEIVFRKWVAETEEMLDLCSEEEKSYCKANLRTLDQNLGPYPFDIWKKWLSLSHRLTFEVVQRVSPSTKQPTDLPECLASTSGEKDKPSEAAEDVQNPNTERKETARPELNFTKIPERSYPEGASASDITKYSIDKSFILGEILSTFKRSDEILSELQLAFLCFLVGQDYNAFEHWKKLLSIMCSADEMISTNSTLFLEFIGDLYFQLQEVSPDLFVDIVTADNFLIYHLKTFFENVLENTDVESKLLKRTLQLKKFVTKKYQWDFENDLHDPPVVLETNDV